MLDMQKRKILCAAAVLMTLLTLFFTTLPLYAAGTGAANGQSGTAGGVLENAADAVRDAAGNLFGGRQNTDGGNADHQASGLPDDSTLPADDASNGTAGTTEGNSTTLGDTNGDGMTDDGASDRTDTAGKDGFSWGGILLAILAAAAVVVVIIMLIPRKNTR